MDSVVWLSHSGTYLLGIEPKQWATDHQSQSILERSVKRSSPWHDIAAFELNNLPLGLGPDEWELLNRRRNQCSTQWELLKQTIAGQVTLSPSALLALINGITKSYLYEPSQSPSLLVDLLHTTRSRPQFSLVRGEEHMYKLRQAIGTALAMAALADNDYPTETANSCNDPDALLERAKHTYYELATDTFLDWGTESLLLFGLLELLRRPKANRGWELSPCEIRSIGRGLNALGEFDPLYFSVLSKLSLNLGSSSLSPEAHFTWIVSDWFDSAFPEPGCPSETGAPSVPEIDTILCQKLCTLFKSDIAPILMKRFTNAQSLELKILCLKTLRRTFPPNFVETYREQPQIVSQPLLPYDIGFVEQLLSFTETANREDIPYALCMQWIVAQECLVRGQVDTLKALYNKFTTPENSDIPSDLHELGLADLWRADIQEMCRIDPHNVLDSEIVSFMIWFYGQEENRAIVPRDVEPLSLSGEPRTWLLVLRELEASCKAAVESQSNDQEMKQREQIEEEGDRANQQGKNETEDHSD